MKEIPKIIHYVWVGNNKKPDNVLKCIESWKKYLPDYKIKEWNESNFDMNSNSYVSKAYNEKKWAFVSDYIRIKKVYDEGGIYMDTDVLVMKNLDPLLHNKVFIGFERKGMPFTATFGSIKHSKFLKKILDRYNDIEPIFDGSVTNGMIIKDILVNDYNCILNSKRQLLKNEIMVYEDYILCNPSTKSYTIHTFSSSWLDKRRYINVLDEKFKMNLGNKKSIYLYKVFEYSLIKPKGVYSRIRRKIHGKEKSYN